MTLSELCAGNDQVKGMNRRVRLLIVTHYLDKGGLEEVILMYAKFLNKDRYDVAVACRIEGTVAREIASLPGVRVMCYDGLTRRKRMWQLFKFARGYRPDIIHNHFSWYGLILSILVNSRCIETIHNTYQWLPPFQKFWYGINCALSARVIAVSENVKRFSATFFPFIKENKIDVIHNGIDTDKFRGDQSHSGLRTRLGIPDTAIVIGFIGRIEEQKGLPYLLGAAIKLQPLFNHVWFVIIGDGSKKSELETQARQLDIQRILFLEFQRETPPYFHMFDIFVLPSLFEGLPVSLLEAMSAGCPVVATKVGGVSEVVRDDSTGILVDPKSTDHLALALKRLVEDDELRKRMGTLGRQHIYDEFSVQAMIEKTEKIYNELLGTSATA